MNTEWIEIEEKMRQMAAPYIADWEKWVAHYDGRVRYKKYAKGGLSVPWGVFCPSFALDKIIGNINRGKLYKRVPGNVIPDYEFGFDEDDNLVTIASKSLNNSKEFVVRFEDEQLGVQFNDFSSLVGAYSLCYSKYVNNQIATFCKCDYHQKKLRSCWCEIYHYEDHSLKKLDLLNVGAYHGRYSIVETHYYWKPDLEMFVRIENG